MELRELTEKKEGRRKLGRHIG